MADCHVGEGRVAEEQMEKSSSATAADERPSRKRAIALAVAAAAVAVATIVCVLGFVSPGYFLTPELDVGKVQTAVQKVLTDEVNGYGADNVKDVSCNRGANPIVEKGGMFDCTATVDGDKREVTVTIQDDAGTYEIGRPK